jgi:hypothetical protein
MKLTFQDKQVLRNIVLSNREIDADGIIFNLNRIFDLTERQREYIREVRRVNG